MVPGPRHRREASIGTDGKRSGTRDAARRSNAYLSIEKDSPGSQIQPDDPTSMGASDPETQRKDQVLRVSALSG